MELPPRTRRIPLSARDQRRFFGTTSAHAENTFIKDKVGTFSGNYLRARGEYRYNHGPVSAQSELPPRTRRIQKYRTSGGG